MTKNITNYIFY